MARADTPTLLSLDDYARVMGINLAHFNGAAHSVITPVIDNACTDIWPQYSWQAADRVSRDDLAQEIASAEQDIASFLNYWPAPMWIAQENHPYPKHHRPDVVSAGGYDVRTYHKAITTNYGYVVAPGQREVAAVGAGTADVDLSSEDGDAYNETATVEIETTLTDECEIKIYFSGKSRAQEWEVRPARTKAISGGTFTATFWAWQLINPTLWDTLPTTDGQSAIDWTDGDNIVDSVDVYREYNDTTETSARFYWEPKTQPLDWVASLNCGCGGSGCEACALTTQTGCLHIRNAVSGLVVPEPATYSESDAAWSSACWTECRDPDMVQLYYYAGVYGDRWRRDETCEPLSRWWQQTIAWLATARLERPFCSCENASALGMHLKQDLALMSETSYQVNDAVLANPFGTRRGEVLAWQRLSKLAKKRMKAALA